MANNLEISRLKELAQTIEMLYLENLLQDDLTISEMIALHIISSLKNPTIVEFANSIKISQSNATYVIHKLVRKGYINKVPSETDGRVFLLSVTDKYVENLNFYEQVLKDLFEKVQETLSEEEEEVLEKICTTVENELAES